MSQRFSFNELKDVIDKLFDHYKKKMITEQEFRHFLEHLSFSVEEIDEIWFQAFKQGLIDLGVEHIENKYVMVILKPLSDEEGD